MSRRMLSRRSASVMNGSAVVWVDGASSGQARPRAGGSRGDRGGGADQTLVLCWPLLAHHTDRTIEASGGARLRTDDRGKSGRGSVAIGVRRPMTEATGRTDQTMLGCVAPRLLVINRTMSSKSAFS